MKKVLVFLAVLLMMLAAASCGVKSADTENVLSSEDETGSGKAGTSINGEKADAGQALSGNSAKELPVGFPVSVPLYDGAQIIEAEEYGTGGYTVVYQVAADYSNVVAYYMAALPGLDESCIGGNEAYFEDFDLADGVHINGLTIEGADETTQVFITLKGADNQTPADDTDYGDEDINETESDYDSITGLSLKDGYPEDVVPLYQGLKLTTSSGAPSGDFFSIEGVAPPDSFENAVAFYQNALGGSPEAFKSPSMRTAKFKGNSSGWSYTLYIAEIYTSGNTVIQVSLTK